MAMTGPSTDVRIIRYAIDSGLSKFGVIPGGGGNAPTVSEPMLATWVGGSC